MAKIIWITEQFQHFLSELKESFWATCTVRRSRRGRSSSSWIRSASGIAFPAGIIISGVRGRLGVSQWILLAGFSDALWDAAAADRAGAGKEFPARRPGAVPAAGGREIALLIREAFLRGISTGRWDASWRC